MTDASGVTNYSYDVRDRMTQKTGPEGALSYSYDPAGNLLSLSAVAAMSSSPTVVNYTYDALNRLSTVAEANTGPTQYNYDAVGNLASFTQPNGVTHAYTYDTQNRLTSLSVAAASSPSSPLASYAYTLDPAGHRTAVTEKSGRTVNYQYDNIYRLTSETIASDPDAINGAIGYQYDSVGNRLQQTSTVTGIVAGLFNYDPDDRLNTDTYDSNGNTLTSPLSANTNVYDFENRLVQQGAVTIVYDGDGNRVSKSVNGVITKYLVDDGINPTGFSQVILEDNTANGETQYVYGLERISERWQGSATSSRFTNSFYGYDGHGSVRFLMDSAGTVTDTYDYDAFGNLLHITGTTPNVYRFAGEQWDPDLNLYYNRARYMNTATGRFITVDSFEGDPQSPPSLHKYLYAAADAIDLVDPTGKEFGLAEFGAANSIAATLNNIEAIQGQAIMDQISFGGNAGLKSLLVAGGFVIGGVVVFKVVGGTIRYINAAVYNLDSKIALSEFSQAAQYGILPFKNLADEVPVGSGLQKHHLIEVRFAETLGVSANDIPSIALTPAEHQVFTNAWLDQIGRRNGSNPINTATATVDDIWRAAQIVYQDHPFLLEFVRKFMGK